jgi:hypothetical protein
MGKASKHSAYYVDMRDTTLVRPLCDVTGQHRSCSNTVSQRNVSFGVRPDQASELARAFKILSIQRVFWPISSRDNATRHARGHVYDLGTSFRSFRHHACL